MQRRYELMSQSEATEARTNTHETKDRQLSPACMEVDPTYRNGSMSNYPGVHLVDGPEVGRRTAWECHTSEADLEQVVQIMDIGG